MSDSTHHQEKPMVLTTIQLRAPLRDIQHIHALTRAAHPDRPLWALPAPTTLLVQADTPTRLHPHIARDHTDTTITTPPAGTPVVVSLIATPTWMPAHARTRRLLPEPEWDDWLTRKTSHALALDTITHHHIRTATGRRGPGHVTHTWVAWHAHGTVTDHDALATLQAVGVGPGKAYGAGLLLARPTTTQEAAA